MLSTGKIAVHRLVDNSWLYDIEMGVGNFMPSGFTASVVNQCLYIGNRFRKCIYKVTIRGEGIDEHVEGFLTMTNDEYPQSLSVSPDGRLVALIATENAFSRTWKGRIVTYRSDASVEFSIPVDEVQNPWCVTFCGNNRFAFTYGVAAFGVMIVDSSKRVIAQCEDQFKMPRSIKYNSAKDRLFIADSGNFRIMSADMEFKKCKMIHTWSGSDRHSSADRQPMRIGLIGDTEKMIVGMESEGTDTDAVELNDAV